MGTVPNCIKDDRQMIRYVQEVSLIGYEKTAGDPVREEVYNWASEMGFNVGGGTVLVNPETFLPNRTWFFESEEVKLLFLLKWS